jgi:hypothetical protein
MSHRKIVDHAQAASDGNHLRHPHARPPVRIGARSSPPGSGHGSSVTSDPRVTALNNKLKTRINKLKTTSRPFVVFYLCTPSKLTLITEIFLIKGFSVSECQENLRKLTRRRARLRHSEDVDPARHLLLLLRSENFQPLRSLQPPENFQPLGSPQPHLDPDRVQHLRILLNLLDQPNRSITLVRDHDPQNHLPIRAARDRDLLNHLPSRATGDRDPRNQRPSRAVSFQNLLRLLHLSRRVMTIKIFKIPRIRPFPHIVPRIHQSKFQPAIRRDPLKSPTIRRDLSAKSCRPTQNPPQPTMQTILTAFS